MTVSQAAEAIGRSAPTLWRIEKGGSPMRPGDVAGMCLIYGASTPDTEALTALAKETSDSGWWRSYHGAIPKWFDTFVGLEQAASHIRLYDAEFVPGLLQTERYAVASFRATGADPEKVTVRMRRQRILTRRAPEPPKLEVVLGEAVLLRPPRDRKAMVEQLQALRDSTELPNVTIRVLPLEVSLECTPDGRFQILDFPAERGGRHQEPSMIYNDNLTGAIYLDKPAEVAAYRGVWQRITDNALSQADSLDLIKSVSERYEQ